MAEDDLRDAWRDFEAGSYASSVYHAELSCQKVLKALNKIIKPSEIYDKEKAGALIDNAEHVLRKIKEIVGGIDC
jgi:HEPN domain-containing protein